MKICSILRKSHSWLIMLKSLDWVRSNLKLGKLLLRARQVVVLFNQEAYVGFNRIDKNAS